MAERLVGEKLEAAIDMRLHDLWGDTVDFDEFDLEVVGIFMRNAYARGYTDALKDKGAFMRDELGYPLPRGEAGRGQAGGPAGPIEDDADA